MVCPITQPHELHLRCLSELKFAYTAFSTVAYGYRSYSPELGRWINRDPIGELGVSRFYKDWLSSRRREPNPYVFSLSNPMNNVDLLGLLTAIGPANGAPAPAEAVITITECTILVVVGHNWENDSQFGLQRVFWWVPDSGCFNAAAVGCFTESLPANENPNFHLLPGVELPFTTIPGGQAIQMGYEIITGSIAENAAKSLGKKPCCCASVSVIMIVQEGNFDWTFSRNNGSRTITVTPDPCCEKTKAAGSVTVEKYSEGSYSEIPL